MGSSSWFFVSVYSIDNLPSTKNKPVTFEK